MIVRAGTKTGVPRALEIWRDAVDATHGFRTARGFVRIGSSDTDPQGRPYPLVLLRHTGAI